VVMYEHELVTRGRTESDGEGLLHDDLRIGSENERDSLQKHN